MSPSPPYRKKAQMPMIISTVLMKKSAPRSDSPQRCDLVRIPGVALILRRKNRVQKSRLAQAPAMYEPTMKARLSSVGGSPSLGHRTRHL
jgi:hypothetical protein